MATGTNGIATVNDLVTGKNLNSPSGYASNQCPTKADILNMGGSVPSTYGTNQLVKYSDVTGTSNITRDFIIYNWGNVPIYNIQFTLENTDSLVRQDIIMGGQGIPARGGYAYGNHGIGIIGSGSGNIRVIGPILVNNSAWTGTGKINLSAVTDLANGTQPTTWTNSVGAYYFTSGTSKLKIDLNFP